MYKRVAGLASAPRRRLGCTFSEACIQLLPWAQHTPIAQSLPTLKLDALCNLQDFAARTQITLGDSVEVHCLLSRPRDDKGLQGSREGTMNILFSPSLPAAEALRRLEPGQILPAHRAEAQTMLARATLISQQLQNRILPAPVLLQSEFSCDHLERATSAVKTVNGPSASAKNAETDANTRSPSPLEAGVPTITETEPLQWYQDSVIDVEPSPTSVINLAASDVPDALRALSGDQGNLVKIWKDTLRALRHASAKAMGFEETLAWKGVLRDSYFTPPWLSVQISFPPSDGTSIRRFCVAEPMPPKAKTYAQA